MIYLLLLWYDESRPSRSQKVGEVEISIDFANWQPERSAAIERDVALL
jgi:hypothetical protein